MKRITKLLGVLLAATACGVMVVLGVLYFTGAFGGLFIKEYLTSPEKLRELSVEEDGTKFVFDRITFNDYNLVSQRGELYKVSLEQYAKILETMGGSTKISRDDYLTLKFVEENPATLTIHILPENSDNQTLSRTYQEIQFLNNSDYFRIELLGKEGPHIWGYYRLPEAYDKVKKIIMKGTREK